MGIISTKTHGVLDYLTAGSLFALPRALGWDAKVTGLLTMAAVGTLSYSLVTRYELGAVKLLPMKGHLAMDALSGLAFCGAPLLLPDEDAAITSALAAIGVFELVVTALTAKPD